MSFTHIPVLLDEVLCALDVLPDGLYIDGTAGGGGHSEAIAKRLTSGRLVAIDRDPDALQAAGERLKPYSAATVVQGNFADMRALLDTLGLGMAQGILLDLGVSSHQLDTAERGFSFHTDAPLDMRMSQQGETAAQLLSRISEEELSRIFFEYGEEKFARRIARTIVETRERTPIETTGQLAELIKLAVPAAARRDSHPARRCFQALRIAVNGELDNLSKALDAAADCLAPGGVMAVITFHSLEDRLVKQRFANWVNPCTCPPDFPVCVCGKRPFAQPVTKKPVAAGKRELEQNPRSRSAKLRAVRRTDENGQP